jgi:hypothetical protein
MNPVAIYVCGWALGVVALRHLTFHEWNHPKVRADMGRNRRLFADPRGLLGVFVCTLIFWWVFVLLGPLMIWEDRHFGDDDGEER